MSQPNPHPKFAVGEPVLIYSADHPDIQGFETNVVGKEYGDFELPDGTTGEGWAYEVSPDPKPSDGWMESALRKRPSDYSFKELMAVLKTPEEQHA